jgi:serine/threonine protein kinase
MPIAVGTKLGTYEIVAPLGAGGMGEVYRARDSKLKREVAIKVLPEAFARDAERLTRFQREAELLASLNHPHIAGIYDVAHFEDSRFLVLELVEGETLADRIRRGPVPFEDACGIAKQIAAALEAAHEKGIIHRDLKPANIKLTPDGSVKVLDFGLAKVREEEGSSAVLSNSPTVASATMPGVILGTAAYMSPEQVRGKDAGRTSDVWAFGCVIYEMLTARSVFEGETVGEIFAGILKEEPAWHQLPADVPQGLRRVLQRCLRKDRKLRMQHAGDVRIEIDEALADPTPPSEAVVRKSKQREAIIFVGALVLLMLLVGVAGVANLRSKPTAPEIHLELTTPPAIDFPSLAISQDGQKIVFAADQNGRDVLWLRSLDSQTSRPLPGTEGASRPFWSPDGRSIGFIADDKLKRIDIDGGSPQIMANASGWFGSGTWNRDGVILYTSLPGHPIFRVPSTGGASKPATRLEAGQSDGHFGARFLPDGHHFLYFIRLGKDLGANLGDIESTETKRLIEGATDPLYVAPGYILFLRQGSLFAEPFDLDKMEMKGRAFQLAENVEAFSASGNGTIIYRHSSDIPFQPVWVDRTGKEINKIGQPDASYNHPELSPDGRYLAVLRVQNVNVDLWTLELAKGLFTRLTSDPANEVFPAWSADGESIAFSSTRIKGIHDLYQKRIGGDSAEELLLATDEDKLGGDWSRDKQYLLYFTYDAKTQHDIWALSMTGERKPFPVIQTEFEERNGRFSPDGNWVAYQSNESGRFEIYVHSLRGHERATRISTGGGAQVRWRSDGKELFFTSLDGWMMAAPISFAAGGKAVEAGTPAKLFPHHLSWPVESIDGPEYVVSSDGQRFLIDRPTQDVSNPPISVILNWKPKE